MLVLSTEDCDMWKEHFDKDICILDGGLATELERNGFSFLKDPLWSARILYSSPKSVTDVHKCYLKHGADIITTASYQASIPGFQKHLGITEEKSKELLKLSVDLAKKAREEYRSSSDKSKILIAGSVGPYGAALADGSEYTGDYCDTISHEELIDWHRPRIKCLVDAGVDLLAFETIPAKKEGEALMKLLSEFSGIKAWLSFSSNSMHHTAHGESISSSAEACLKLSPANQLVAIGVNCCPPEYAEGLLKDISCVCPNFSLIVYPNSGEKWNSQTGWSGERTMSSSSFLQSWVNTSAKIIGGCCRTTPEDIAKIQKFFHNNEK